jgi:hypothetical protein
MASIDESEMLFPGGRRYDPQDGGFPWLRATFLFGLGATALLPFFLLLAQQAGK